MHAELPLFEATFRALGSHCRIVSDVEHSLLDSVHRLEDLEARWSRFISTSEVSQLNACSGDWVDVSDITRRLISRACEASERTSGVMNPLLLKAMVELGYDRSHELLDAADSDIEPGTPFARDHWVAPVASHIEIEGGRVRLPIGSAFDPGGVGKGLAADILMEDLLGAGAKWALVSLGGDLRFGGDELLRRGWETHIEHPGNPGHVWGSVRISSGALATSSTMSRRWHHQGVQRHHLLNPATGRPASGSRLAATVHADEAWWADVIAKVLVVDGDVGQRAIDNWGVRALVFDEEGPIDFGLDAVESAAFAPT
ncbi:MAG: FAD:protein FMN transferase [Acidimicrobiia bacterium]|nr:FAD:protein FMN transferase [Acidimicrobiia bacterium]